MKKIISLFERDYTQKNHPITTKITTGAEWVIKGEGTATRKWDGACCMIKDGVFFKRYDAKHGKTPPPDFIPAQDPDQKTGHWPGWIPVRRDNPADKYFLEAFDAETEHLDGTYELCGPKVSNNPENLPAHRLLVHGAFVYSDCPRDFDGLKIWLAERDIEGIVWHHPDGRMVKIKKKDFGLTREKTK